MKRSLLLALAALCAVAPGAVAKAKPKPKPPTIARPALVVGMADQKPVMFSDPRFTALGVRHARLAVAWDALRYDWQVKELDAWLLSARYTGVVPLVTFSQSRIAGRTRIAPTAAELLGQFNAFRARYPWVTEFSAWNEANYCGQPTCKKPELVARYWKALTKVCPTCKVLGADLLDLPSMPDWVVKFRRSVLPVQPAYWGLHNYVTANRFLTTSIQQLLALSGGEVWLTETGGLVARRNRSTVKLPQGIAHAAQVTSFILRTAPQLSPRITRAYLYQWNQATGFDSWDSGFIGPDGTVRPSLDVLRAFLPPSAAGPVAPVVPQPAHAPPPESPPVVAR